MLLKENKNTSKASSTHDDEDEDSGMEDNKPKYEKGEKNPSVNQYSEPDDYFSFFSSHEKLLLRPEKSFKHLRKFIKYLPVDYYVLLQENFDTKTEFVESNYVMFRNLPVITKNLTSFKGYPNRHVTYEDLTRCTEFEEIESIVDGDLALNELRNQLQKYGTVEDIELLTR